ARVGVRPTTWQSNRTGSRFKKRKHRRKILDAESISANTVFVMEQLGFKLKGPKRKPRRGRPPKKDAGVSHLRRPALASRFPVHVTLRVKKGVWPLRTSACFRALRQSFARGRERFGFRLNQFSVQGNHLHLIA